MQSIPITQLMETMANQARLGARALGVASADTRTLAIRQSAKSIRSRANLILEANLLDQDYALKKGLTAAMLERLVLTPERIEAMACGVEAVANLDDPVGRELARWTRPNGLDIARVSTPIGVIAIIFESRPNVTADAAALCIRSGNAAILRCGSEALNSAKAIYSAFEDGLKSAGLSEYCVQLVPTSDREAVGLILGGLDNRVDLIIPRGGKSLVERVQKEARAPVLAHLEGLNHTYIHERADLQKAVDITLNAKMRRVGVCGATETLLIDEAIAQSFLAPIAEALIISGCELRGDDVARGIYPMAVANEDDWRCEYLAPIISIRVVKDYHQAIDHIKTYGTQHTECIITQDEKIAEKFLKEVDSAIVMWNASTQFADGGEFGLGAEIGIATGRLHARGPIGADQLTTFKYMVRGIGQTRR